MEISNTKKMREALERSTRRLEAILSAFECGEMSKYINADIQDNRAALAAPTRNCDRFETEDEARIAFLEYYWLIDCVDLKGQDRPEVWTDEMNREFAKWLYKTDMHLPADTLMQKGDDHADK